MASEVRGEIAFCIRELYDIANKLENAADEVDKSISGMNTRPYSRRLYESVYAYLFQFYTIAQSLFIAYIHGKHQVKGALILFLLKDVWQQSFAPFA